VFFFSALYSVAVVVLLFFMGLLPEMMDGWMDINFKISSTVTPQNPLWNEATPMAFSVTVYGGKHSASQSLPLTFS